MNGENIWLPHGRFKSWPDANFHEGVRAKRLVAETAQRRTDKSSLEAMALIIDAAGGIVITEQDLYSTNQPTTEGEQ